MAQLHDYLVSFGDSDKYSVSYPGTKEEFEKSEVLQKVVETVKKYLSEKFPTGGYEDVVTLHVEENKDKGYLPLDEKGISELLKSVETQVKVMRKGEEETLNAPYDKD